MSLDERSLQRFKCQCFVFLTMEKKLINFLATSVTEAEFVWGNYTKIVEDRFLSSHL